MRLSQHQKENIWRSICAEFERVKAIPLERIQEGLNYFESGDLSVFTLGDLLELLQEHDDAN
jgi:hypothetical protein